MLRVDSITAGYGDTTVLRNVSLNVGDGEVIALLGPNGAGKTTLLRTISGFVKPRSGQIEFDGEDLTSSPPFQYVRHGICHLPEGRGIFPTLTVFDNLVIMARSRNQDEVIAQAAALFPVLGVKLRQTAGSLSGGEQQMLALSRAYVTNPKLLVVDEASLGLAPIMVDKIYEALDQLVKSGMSLIVVEQYVQKALALCENVYVVSRGMLNYLGSPGGINLDDIYHSYLGI